MTDDEVILLLESLRIIIGHVADHTPAITKVLADLKSAIALRQNTAM